MSSESPSHFGPSVGARIRSARHARKMTQSQLAGSDFSVSYISAIERGQIQPSIRALEILAARLNITAAQLLPGMEGAEMAPGVDIALSAQSEKEVEQLLLEAEVCIHAGKEATASEQLRSLAINLLPRHQQARVYYLLGLAAFAGEHLPEAEKYLTLGLQLLSESEDLFLQAQLCYISGLIHVSMQNYQQAEHFYERCLEILERLSPRDDLFVARVHWSLGHYHLSQNRPDKAIEFMQRSVAIIDACEAAHQPEQTYYHLSIDYALNGDYTRAALQALKAFYAHSQRSWRRQRSELVHALYRLLLRRPAESEQQHTIEELQELSASPEPLQAASACAHLARWFSERHEQSEAFRHAERALMLARPFGDSEIQAEALLVLGHLAYERAHFDEGDTHIESGLAMLERLQTDREQLAEHYSAYARLLEGRGKEREAFQYFRRAYEIGQRRLVH